MLYGSRYGGYLSNYRYRYRYPNRRRYRSRFTSTSNDEYEYGSRRRRPYWWEREDEVSRRGYRNRRRRMRRRRRERRDRRDRSPSPESDGSPPRSPKPEPKPDPPKEELVKVLNVKGIDLNIAANTKKHRTDQYACTEDRKDRGGKHLPAELVVRRGDSINMTIKFDRPFEKKKHDMVILFSVGENPTVAKGTLAEIKVDESGKETYKHNQWGASLRETRGNDIDLEVFIPSNCIVGEWNLSIRSLSTGKDESGKVKTLKFKYTSDDDITILFNAWCKHDPVYMSEPDLREEYVLNETGTVYRGSSRTIGGKRWLFGQFEPNILDASLTLLLRGFNKNINSLMADPVRVSRAISKMVNAQDDSGVLIGNWSGDYAAGTSPGKWTGSVKILTEFLETGQPVKFGQCWVFSAVTTTVCRALGIPTRSVTNFSSAHDTDSSATIDRFRPGEEPHDARGKDSIWNFHVWNEVWMTRRDLDGDGFDGWQVIDATPQERSDHAFQCGPCPVSAVRRGLCKTNFDTCFVYSEVNADEVHWKKTARGYEVIGLDKTKVGRNISTKMPGKDRRLDITDEYKPREGTTEERETMKMAYMTAENPRLGLYDSFKGPVEDLRFELIVGDEIMVGQDLDVTVKISNSSLHTRTIEYVNMKVAPMMYSGEEGRVVLNKTEETRDVKPGEVVKFEGTMKSGDYLPTMMEMASYNIRVTGSVKAVNNDYTTLQFVDIDESFRFRRPDLTVTGPDKSSVGNPVEFKVTFTNPLPIALTECDISAESTGFDNMDDEKQPTIPPNGQFSGKFKLIPNRRRLHTVSFSFDSKELKDISGAADILIT